MLSSLEVVGGQRWEGGSDGDNGDVIWSEGRVFKFPTWSRIAWLAGGGVGVGVGVGLG